MQENLLLSSTPTEPLCNETFSNKMDEVLGILMSSSSGNYIDLINKPKINNIELSGNKTLENLGIQASEIGKGLSTNDFTNDYKNILDNTSSGSVTGVKGSAELIYRTGNINITKTNIGLGNVSNTADNAKNVASANKLTTAININGVSFDGSEDITIEVPTKTSQLANDSNFVTDIGYKTIIYSTTEPTTINTNEIIYVYE